MRHVISTAIIVTAIGVVTGAAAELQSAPRETFSAQSSQSRPPAPSLAAQQAAPDARATSAPVAQRSATAADATLALQIALDRAGFSPGEIDGKAGHNTERALSAFQQASGLAPTGQPDMATIERLGETYENPLSHYAIKPDDVAGPFVENIPEDMMKKADLPALGYTSVRELLAERFHASPELLSRLNPNTQWKQGDVIVVPNVDPFLVKPPEPAARGSNSDATHAYNRNEKGARGAVSRANNSVHGDSVITVTDKTKTLTVTDGEGKVIFHAPVTVGSTNDPLPVGEWKVNGVQFNPAFNYNPELFWDADPTHSKAKLAPGPNNPVGTVWIDLSKEHYGIHGTPEPSRIGYTESHGCIRLTNWDAMRLATLVAPGTKVVLR